MCFAGYSLQIMLYCVWLFLLKLAMDPNNEDTKLHGIRYIYRYQHVSNLWSPDISNKLLLSLSSLMLFNIITCIAKQWLSFIIHTYIYNIHCYNLYGYVDFSVRRLILSIIKKDNYAYIQIICLATWTCSKRYTHSWLYNIFKTISHYYSF